MNPVDWNEYEPAFPDFLPPVQKRELTKDEAVERLEGVLKAAGIKISMYGCSCCGEFSVTFPDGATCDDNQVGEIEADGYTRR
jgi:hypothetical protein